MWRNDGQHRDWEGPPNRNRHGLAWAVILCVAVEVALALVLWKVLS